MMHMNILSFHIVLTLFRVISSIVVDSTFIYKLEARRLLLEGKRTCVPSQVSEGLKIRPLPTVFLAQDQPDPKLLFLPH